MNVISSQEVTFYGMYATTTVVLDLDGNVRASLISIHEP